ncbi:major facilitator superfamily domain-containing protein 9, partial [Campylobacter coli]|nr:major facilitator superfamily domain-containing protein 9 [Campylobacter coli]
FQMGLLGSAYGLLGLFSYALGGYLADRFAPKKLLIFSLVLQDVGVCFIFILLRLRLL